MSPAENLAILIEIYQIHEQFFARSAHKARWVPAGAWSCSGGKNCHISSVDASATLTKTTDDLNETQEKIYMNRWRIMQESTQYIISYSTDAKSEKAKQ